MRILKNKSFFAALISLTVVGIVMILSVYAFHAVERRFYTRSVNGLETIYVAEEEYRLSFPKRGYSRTLQKLGTPATGCTTGRPDPSAACLIDYTLANA